MSNLQDLLDERQRTYSQISDEILKCLESNVIPAILELLELSDRELSKLTWNTVSVADEHILLGGTIIYQPGDVIADDATKVTLTKEMVGLMNKIIKVAVPLKIAENANKEEVMAHLVESERKLRDEYETVYGHNPKALESALKNIPEQIGWDEVDEKILDNVLETATDFEIEDLSEEQLQALMLTHLGGQGKGRMN